MNRGAKQRMGDSMRMRISRRSALTAAAAVVAFALVFVGGHYLCYGALPDARLSRSYFLLIALGGGVPTLLRLYRLGLVFIVGAQPGGLWIVRSRWRRIPFGPTCREACITPSSRSVSH